jgi:recombination protein RecR
MNTSSQYFQNAVDALAGLPGIGHKTATRLALFLMKQEKQKVLAFSNAIAEMKTRLQTCIHCNNISDEAVCQICNNPNRKPDIICIVEDIRDLMAIESTGQYNGLFHVLGGRISPMEGTGPADLSIDLLLQRIHATRPEEIIFALSPTMEGDTTAFFLYRKLADYALNITTLARGIGIGEELQYAHEGTLAQSIRQRMPFSVESQAY